LTILVAGVHAVGKTFIAKSAAQKMGLRYATASQLIREERGRSNWTLTRQISDIDENQVALVTAVARIRNEGRKLLLDGHLVLRSRPTEHRRIGPEVFHGLQCRRIFVLTAPVPVILSRLRARGDDSWTPEEVEVFSAAEVQHGQFVAARLAIPLTVLDSPNADQFGLALQSA
jgi:adenylate kinase